MASAMTTPSPDAAASGVMNRLKAETRAAHDATEAIPFSDAMVKEHLPRAAYIGQLAAYRVIHEALEDALRTSSDPAVRAVWTEDLAKAPLLDTDLAYFTAEIPTVPPAALDAAEAYASAIRDLASSNPPALLGHLYVLEGSTLGATILRMHLANMYDLDLETADGLKYYSPYGNQVMPHWMQFKARMNEAVSEPAQQDAVVNAAKDAFDRIGRVLVALTALLDGDSNPGGAETA